MEYSGLFWVVAVTMAVVACSFVASPLLRSSRKAVTIVAAVAVPLMAAGLYMQLGSPEAANADDPIRSSQGVAVTPAGSERVGSVASMVDGLASRLQENPDDAGSWLLLARSYQHLGRIEEANDAYKQAALLGQYDAELEALSSDTAGVEVVSAQIFGSVKLSMKARDIVRPTDTVFIFAKAVGGPSAPLAVLQRAASELPIDFLLNDSQSMISGVKLSDFEEVVVTARITRDSDATTLLQGLEAKSDTIVVAENRHLNLTIE